MAVISRRLRPSGRTRALATISADQVVNTGSNFLAVALVAHVLSPIEFGVFSTAQVVALVMQVAAQAGSSDQLLSVPDHEHDQRRLIALSVRDRYAVLLLAAMTVFAVALLCHGTPTSLVLFVISYIGGLVFTDFIRNLLYATRHATRALTLDIVLAVVQVALLLVWRTSGEADASTAWEALAGSYLLLALVGLIVSVRILGPVLESVTRSRFRWRYAAEMGLTLGISQLAQLVFIAVAGVGFAGHYRAVLLLLGPSLLLINAARPMLIFLYARRRDRRVHMLTTSALATACLLWGALCLALPLSVREAVLGRQADIDRSLLLATTALAVGQAMFTAAFYRARALGDDNWTTRSKLLQAGAVVAVTAVATPLRNPDLLVLGFALGAFLPVLIVPQRRVPGPTRGRSGERTFSATAAARLPTLRAMSHMARNAVAALGVVVVLCGLIYVSFASDRVSRADQVVGPIAHLKRHSMVLWIGDSYTAGTGATSQQGAYPALISNHFGWSWVLDAEGGTGFVNNGHDNSPNFHPVPARLSSDKRRYPRLDLIVIDAGRDDGVVEPFTVEPIANRYFDRVSKLWPNAKVVLIAPYYIRTSQATYSIFRAFEKVQARRRGWYFIDPISQGWISNRIPKSFVSSDGIHPDERGQVYIADHLEQDLAAERVPINLRRTGPFRISP